MPTKIDNKWYVDFRPRGRDSRRYRKSFPTKAEALRYKNHVLSTRQLVTVLMPVIVRYFHGIDDV